MIQQIFRETMDGLSIARLIRDEDYVMHFRHFHETYELYFLIDGEIYYFIDKETYRLKKNMVALINKAQIHKTSMGETPYHDRILIQMSHELLSSFFENNQLFSIEDFFSQHYGVLEIQPDDWQIITANLFSIEKELRLRKEHYPLIVKSKLAEILIILYRYRKTANYDQQNQVVQTAKYQKVNEIANYLISHCETTEDLQQLAKRFYISKSYLCRIFREVTGYTVNEYINTNRIQKAKHLLQHSDYSITEISDLLGFENISYFERVFKKHTETTPLKYRKTLL